MNNNIERRLFTRIPLWLIVKYRLYPRNIEPSEEFREGICKNISAGGICLATEERLEKGFILDLEIRIPALAQDIHVMGRVVWSCPQKSTGGFICGLKFIKINPKDFKDIKEIIETFTPHTSKTSNSGAVDSLLSKK